jgi:hypothetical protein
VGSFTLGGGGRRELVMEATFNIQIHAEAFLLFPSGVGCGVAKHTSQSWN